MTTFTNDDTGEKYEMVATHPDIAGGMTIKPLPATPRRWRAGVQQTYFIADASCNSTAMREWGDPFQWDDDPCGFAATQEKIDEYLFDANEIGYIEDKQLHITKAWKVPTAYGYKPDMTPVVTSWDKVGKV